MLLQWAGVPVFVAVVMTRAGVPRHYAGAAWSPIGLPVTGDFFMQQNRWLLWFS